MAFAVLGLIFLAYQNVFAQASLPHLMLILGSIGVLFLGIGLVIPNALSQALSCYQQSIGTAGALFGLIYYMMIASLTFLMGIFHNGTALPMPLYFLALVVLMYCSLYYFIIKKLKSPNHLEKQQDLCS